jgi:NitT/TauT family transport system substrate-binding protein
LLKSPRNAAALLALVLVSAPAFAQEPVRIGVGFGLAFLPVYVCEELKLVEKHAREMHLDVKVSYQRFMGAGPLQDAIASAAIDMGPFGTAPLLMTWDKAKGTPRQVFAISGITTMPLTLLSNRPSVLSIADFKRTDRIALPTLSSPQMYLLEMQSEKILGQYDRFRSQVIELSPANAINDLMDGAGAVAAYFSSPPFTQIALSDAKLHKLLGSEDIIGGRLSFLIMGATKAYIGTHPKMADVIDRAMDEAARLIHDDPRRAAQIYLTHEPSKALDAAELDAVLREYGDEFGSSVYGVDAFADFMGRHGELKAPPQGWKEIVAPALLNSPST